VANPAEDNDRQAWFARHWQYGRRFGRYALIGVPAGVLLALLARQPGLVFVGVLAALPYLGWLVVVPILHWRDRYVGERSTAWGALMVLETSGWSKLVYWFRHVLADREANGRYRDQR